MTEHLEPQETKKMFLSITMQIKSKSNHNPLEILVMKNILQLNWLQIEVK